MSRTENIIQQQCGFYTQTCLAHTDYCLYNIIRMDEEDEDYYPSEDALFAQDPDDDEHVVEDGDDDNLPSSQGDDYNYSA